MDERGGSAQTADECTELGGAPLTACTPEEYLETWSEGAAGYRSS
jgi:hypothetical protein